MFILCSFEISRKRLFCYKIFFEPIPPNPFSSKHMRFVFNGWVMVFGDPTPSPEVSKFRSFVGWFGG